MKHPRYLTIMAIVLALLSPAAHASHFQGETLDSIAKWLALFIIFVLPIGGIWLFWMIHILPEKVAEKRHHPQKDAIKTLCLLSLLFGGLLWPFAWLWAYAKPVTYKLAYGTEKHTDYYLEAGEKAMKKEMTLDGNPGVARGTRPVGGRGGISLRNSSRCATSWSRRKRSCGAAAEGAR